MNKRYDFQQPVVSVPVFAGSFDLLLYYAARPAQSGAVSVQPCILRVGRAGLYCADACVDPRLVHGRDCR